MARMPNGPTTEERRRQIMDAALRVFAEKGFTGATNKDIGREASVAPGLIYHYFADKRALFDALFAERVPLAATGALLAIDGAENDEPRAVLGRLFSTLLARMDTEEDLCVFKLLTGEAMRDAGMLERFNANAGAVVADLASYLANQVARGRLRPLEPTVVAQLLIGSLIQMMMRRNAAGDPVLRGYDLDKIAGTLVEMALGGLEVRAVLDAAAKP